MSHSVIVSIRSGSIDTLSSEITKPRKNRGDIELTFLMLAEETILTEVCQYMMDVSNIFFKSIQVDQTVLEVDNAENIKKFMKAIGSICLHRCRSIHETEGHDEIFEVVIQCSECGFPFIAESDLQVIEGIAEIELGVVLHIFNAVEEF